jgi:hypothetical protein
VLLPVDTRKIKAYLLVGPYLIKDNFITIVFAILYIFIAEMFLPTELMGLPIVLVSSPLMAMVIPKLSQELIECHCFIHCALLSFVDYCTKSSYSNQELARVSFPALKEKEKPPCSDGISSSE